MNAIKFVVLFLIGFFCANYVGAIRQLQEGSKETKVSISIPEIATTKGIGAALSEVIIYTRAYAYGCGYANAKKGPKGSSGNASGCCYGETSGYVITKGPNASASSRSTAYGQGRADAAAGRNGATASGTGSGGGSTVASGRISP